MRRNGPCCLCSGLYEGWGNNPEPLADFGTQRCCNRCNTTKVIPERLRNMGFGDAPQTE